MKIHDIILYSNAAYFGLAFRFGFVGSGTSSGQFVIEEITGVIRLHSKSISLERDKYELNVTAVDDGACCVNGAATIHTSTAVVVVFITDVNDNKPVFRECAKYNPKVEEGAPNGSPVLKVRRTTSRVIILLFKKEKVL